MSLVKAKCTQCGEIIEVDKSKEAAICPRCNNPFVTEKAIKNYAGGGDNARTDEKKEFVIVAGELKKYTGESPDVVIPEGVSKIGTKKEMYDGELTDFNIFSFTPIRSLKLPKSITEIGYSEFYSCPNLKKVELADTVTKIGSLAFMDCKSLEEINIPSSVKEIGERVFANCTALKTITIPEGASHFSNTFAECTNLKYVSLPSSARTLYNTFVKCTSLESIAIPAGVTVLKYTFTDCKSLKQISIPSTVKQINGAFGGCSALTDLTVPASVETVEYGFNYCDNLVNVTILGQNTKFDYFSFKGCNKLKTITVNKKNKKTAKKVIAELKKFYGLKVKLSVAK